MAKILLKLCQSGVFSLHLVALYTSWNLQVEQGIIFRALSQCDQIKIAKCL